MTDLQLGLQQDWTTNGQFIITRFEYKWIDLYIFGGGGGGGGDSPAKNNNNRSPIETTEIPMVSIKIPL